MYYPESTYRIQFHKGFTFAHLERILPYLHKLGIKTIYASPVFMASEGSAHGYDGTDPNRVNPEIGTLEQWRKIAARLRELQMGWIQDFVPNHMAYSAENKWVADMWEKGSGSPYNSYFDKKPGEPVMAPFLPDSLEKILENNELSLVYKDGRLRFCCFDVYYPLNYRAYREILSHPEMQACCSGATYVRVLEAARRLENISGQEAFTIEWDQLVSGLQQVLRHKKRFNDFTRTLTRLSRQPDFLHKLAGLQFYRLCCWKETNTRINYRRFFTINSLICLNMEHPEVFRDYHRLLHMLVKENIIQGVRIDHIDGLYDPAGYLVNLRRLLGADVHITTEKILAPRELLPAQWPVAGTTGYDFLGYVSQLLTNQKHAAAFSEFYRTLSARKISLEQQIRKSKSAVLSAHMQGEWDNLVALFCSLPGLAVPRTVTTKDIQNLIRALLTGLPVYRLYPEQIPLSSSETALLRQVMSGRPHISRAAVTFFLACFSAQALSEQERTQRLHFLRRCMQVSAALMAKGMEDTFMYRNFWSLAHNEVGDTPEQFGMDTAAFHDAMALRQYQWPMAFNTIATHDTKRGADTRARLLLLTTQGSKWLRKVRSWMNAAAGMAGPLTPEDQYFAIQTVYGGLPFSAEKDWPSRLREYLIKAVREGKLHSDWEKTDTGYEHAMTRYALAIADRKRKPGKSIRHWLKAQRQEITAHSLAQLTLQCTCPGIPDIYQGTELWDLSFVDPDNRRPVDYSLREAMLADIVQGRQMKNKAEEQGGIKLFTLYALLQLRKAHPDVFRKGLYIPVAITHPNRLAFIRRYRHEWILIIVALDGRIHTKKRMGLLLPSGAPRRWKNIFTGSETTIDTLNLPGTFSGFPVAVFEGIATIRKRKAGILMPLCALPSPYGIGGLGKEAFHFASFLAAAGQKAWQMLPLGPVLKSNHYSPYAAASAFAGGPLYIDPEQLVSGNLLAPEDIPATASLQEKTINYTYADGFKSQMLFKAWQHFLSDNGCRSLQDDFNRFCQKEKSWLHDYALHAVARKVYQKPWYGWPQKMKDRDLESMQSFGEKYRPQVDMQKWVQFVFDGQWRALKRYCEQLDICLIGDMPFYMAADSADVWAYRRFFRIDGQGKITRSAGVPPDYFSKNGQLWNMPTYDWQQLELEGYSWWLQRLLRHADLYHLTRLDHFRAFYDYWEVPGKESTAVKGAWKAGPRHKLFDLLQKALPGMPFIAEDLGEIHQGVLDFRDQYRIPGMRVLQFGFDPYNPSLPDLPHNYIPACIAYTGTHDNNTVRGWFREMDRANRESLSHYCGYKIDRSNVGEAMMNMLYKSVAETVIIPLQDVLGLPASARINRPSTSENNWQWRLPPGKKLGSGVADKLFRQTTLFNR